MATQAELCALSERSGAAEQHRLTQHVEEDPMEDEQHERISQLAHELWEKEGRPDGKDAEHWQAARKLVEGGSGDVTAEGVGPNDTAGAPDDSLIISGDPEPNVSPTNVVS